MIRFICENGGTPLGRHTKFKADGGLNAGDSGVSTYENLCKLLQTALTMDQYDVTNSATFELVCRELQMVEERYSDKLRSLDPVFGEDGQYFMETSTGDSNVCMDPRLREEISEQMKSDAAVMKERRKAR